MIRKGILKGDKSFRKFTFDDSKCVNGKYECTYPMDPVERNEFSEPNKVWLSESEMLVIGAPIKKKAPEQNPNQIEQPVEQPKVKTQSTVPEKRKPGRPKKVVNEPAPNVFEKPEGSEKYEYLVEEIQMTNDYPLQDKLNELGDAGWEMCGFETVKQIFTVSILMVFKRKRG